MSYAEVEEGTKHWFALRGHERTYSIFDTFDDQTSRETHLTGQIAQALMQVAAELFEDEPQVVLLDVLVTK